MISPNPPMPTRASSVVGRRRSPAALRMAFAAVLSLSLVAVALASGRGPAVHPSREAARPGLRTQPGETDEVDADGGEASLPDEWMLAQRLEGAGVPAGAEERAAAQALRIRAATARSEPGLVSASWSSLGPTDIGGRLLDIAVDPVHAGRIFVAAASGGVWKTTDLSTLTSVWPRSYPQAVGALAVAPDGTLYAGTGEAGPGGGSITYGGNGLYRSTDGGRSWKRIGLQKSKRISRIVIDPTDPQRIFVAVEGNLFVPGGQRGVYLTTDGGSTWNRVLAGSTPSTGATDLAIDPADHNVVFAAMWDAIRQPDLRVYGGVGSGVYRSQDGGTTWKRLKNGLPGASSEIGRIGLAVAPSNGSRLYAIVISTDGGFQGFYTSGDGGSTWSTIGGSALAGSQSSYGWWFGRVWVDPVDTKHVFVAGVTLEESKDGGATWGSATGGAHADQHAMAWDPNVAKLVYLGNDGGFYHSTVNGSGGWIGASVQPFTQLYSVDVSVQDTTRLVGGAQDNGVLRSYPNDWNGFIGGDGEEALIDPSNQNDVYGCYQYGACFRSTDGGNTLLGFGSTTGARRNWFTPVQFDPNTPSVMYYGSNVLNRSTNMAATWTAISPDLTGGPGRDQQYPFGTITTVAASGADPQRLLVGTDDGRLWWSHDLGSHWTRVTDPNLPGTWVTRVAWDPTDPKVGYATFSGFRSGNQSSYVLRTSDGGTTWADVSGDLPKAPVNDVVVAGGALYVATDVGVYTNTDGRTTWLTVGTGLPLAPVSDIRMVGSSLFAATFGRGVYRIDLAGV